MIRLAGVALIVAFACACHHRNVPSPAPLARGEIIALLPDPETHTVGRVVVSSAGGSVELAGARTTTRIVNGYRPSASFTLSQADVQRLFGEALAARPPAPRHFLLYFESGSNQLTPESEQLIPEILDFVRDRAVPDVTIIGHTDTTGTAHSNFELGLSRANLIRDRLLAAGLDGSLVSVASHGEADLLVPTPDNTP